MGQHHEQSAGGEGCCGGAMGGRPSLDGQVQEDDEHQVVGLRLGLPPGSDVGDDGPKPADIRPGCDGVRQPLRCEALGSGEPHG